MPARGTANGHSPAFTDLDEVVELEIPVRPARKRFALRYLKRNNNVNQSAGLTPRDSDVFFLITSS